MRTLTFLLTLLMATALQAQPLLDEASSTLQPALQQLGRRLLRHKTGSIVAIQPATGRVLCLVTHSPEGEKPALALATPYPPASTMKTAEALMLYSEGLIDDETTVACHGALRTGNIRVHCHSHASPLRLTNALAYSCNTSEYTDLGVNEPALANTMSTDGSVIGGYAWDESTYMQHPIYLKDGVKYDLPMPTSTWLGYEANGFGLTGANADGSMFLGYVQDDFAAYPICVWVLNQDGKTYSVIPVSKRFYDSSIELSGPQPMDYFNGAFMSANGRWVALSVHNKNNTEQSYTLARYDVLNDALEYISCPEATQTLAYYATAISDDGTMIGYINDEMSNARTGVICLAGDTVAHRLSEAFPQVPELAQLDVNELNTPCCITPDGRYITGFGYVDLDDENLCFGTYWIDTKTTDAVDKVSEAAPATKVVGSYGVDGKVKRIAAPKGLRLDKFANGKVKKVVVK